MGDHLVSGAGRLTCPKCSVSWPCVRGHPIPIMSGMRQLAASVSLSELLRSGCLACLSCLLHAHAVRHVSKKKTKTKTNRQTDKQQPTTTNNKRNKQTSKQTNQQQPTTTNNNIRSHFGSSSISTDFGLSPRWHSTVLGCGWNTRRCCLTFGLSGKCSDPSMGRHFCPSSSERSFRFDDERDRGSRLCGHCANCLERCVGISGQ